MSIVKSIACSALVSFVFALACTRAESEIPGRQDKIEAEPISAPSESKTSLANKTAPMSSSHAPIPVTRVVLFESTYDTSKVGYPGTGKSTRTLSKDNYKDFDALIEKVLERTLYNDEVTLGQYIALRLAGNQAEVDRIDALGPRDPGQPSGSGSYHRFSLQNGDTEIYAFRDDNDAYSGSWVRRLHELVANPDHKLFTHGPEQKLYGLMQLRWAAKSYSDQHVFRSAKHGQWLFKLLAGEGDYGGRPEDEEGIDVRVDELLTMPGGNPTLDAQALALTEGLIAFNRSMRKLIAFCIANKPAEDDAAAEALWSAASAEHARFVPLRSSFEKSLHQAYRDHFAFCKSQSKEGSFAQETCQIMLSAQELVDLHEGGSDTSPRRTSFRSEVARLTPASACEREFAKSATELAQVLETMKDVPYYNVVFLKLIESLLACHP